MLIGGTAFSTAGGIKIARLLLIFQKLINKKNMRPHITKKIIQICLPLFLPLQYNFVKEFNNL